MTLKEAHSLALKVLKQVMEEKVDENNVQLAQVSHTRSHLRGGILAHDLDCRSRQRRVSRF